MLSIVVLSALHQQIVCQWTVTGMTRKSKCSLSDYISHVEIYLVCDFILWCRCVRMKRTTILPLGERRWSWQRRRTLATTWYRTLYQRVLNDLKKAQAFSLSYDLAPRSPSPPSLPLVRSSSDTQESWERETTSWRERREWGGRGAESYDPKTVWSSINYSILSALYDWTVKYIDAEKSCRQHR